jgi:hypothetical protein
MSEVKEGESGLLVSREKGRLSTAWGEFGAFAGIWVARWMGDSTGGNGAPMCLLASGLVKG